MGRVVFVLCHGSMATARRPQSQRICIVSLQHLGGRSRDHRLGAGCARTLRTGPAGAPVSPRSSLAASGFWAGEELHMAGGRTSVPSSRLFADWNLHSVLPCPLLVHRARAGAGRWFCACAVRAAEWAPPLGAEGTQQGSPGTGWARPRAPGWLCPTPCLSPPVPNPRPPCPFPHARAGPGSLRGHPQPLVHAGEGP